MSTLADLSTTGLGMAVVLILAGTLYGLAEALSSLRRGGKRDV